MWNSVLKKAQVHTTEWDGNWTEYTNTSGEKSVHMLAHPSIGEGNGNPL